MDTIFAKLEKVLSTGYSILMELEKDEPDMEKIEILYDHRAELLSGAKFNWIQLNETSESVNPEEKELEKIKNLFIRLNLLEKNLNRNLKSLKFRKAEQLKQVNQLKNAKTSYENGYNNGESVSLFMDVKSGT
jgi:thioredoxin reductase